MASSLDTLLEQIRQLQQGNPYDSGLATALQQAQYQMSDLDRSYTRGVQDVESGHEQTTRQLGKDRDRGWEVNEGKFADSGLLHSGIFAGQQGKVGEAYETGLGSAVQRRLEGLNSMAENKRQGESGIQSMLVGAQSDYTARQEAAARARAEAQAAKEAQDRQNALAQQAAAQQQALMQQMIAAQNSAQYGGGGAYGGGGQAAPEMQMTRDAGMMGGAVPVMDDGQFDFWFNVMRQTQGDDAAAYWGANNNRYSGYTLEQRQLMDPNQRRQAMVARRNQ